MKAPLKVSGILPRYRQRIQTGLRHTLDALHHALYPFSCLLCGDAASGPWDLCDPCYRQLPRNASACVQCALPLPAGTRDSRCGECQRDPPAFDHSVAPLLYRDEVQRLIAAFKFHGQLSPGRTLSQVMLAALREQSMPIPEVIIPVPIHPQRLSQRGYNQALELARPIARALGCRLDLESCQRIKPTAPQSSLPLALRQINLRHAFELSRPIQARHLVILDDVMTTGHTARTLARLLRTDPVERLDIWALARTPKGTWSLPERSISNFTIS